jgi:hypothetical protein
LRSFGARAASSSTVSFTYRQVVATPIPNPAAKSVNASPYGTVEKHLEPLVRTREIVVIASSTRGFAMS